MTFNSLCGRSKLTRHKLKAYADEIIFNAYDLIICRSKLHHYASLKYIKEKKWITNY